MHELQTPDRRNVWSEVFAVRDMTGVPGALLGAGRNPAKRASGQPVIVLPGIGAGDSSTIPLRAFLSRHAFKPEGWGLGRNTGGRGMLRDLDELSDRWDIDRERLHRGEGEVAALCDRMIDRVLERFAKLGEPIALVGWSLGGYVAREVARELPAEVSTVITLGSPVVGGPKYTTTAPLFRARNVDLDWIEAETKRRHDVPIQQPVTAIYSKRDGVVGWQAAVDHYSPDVRNVEVSVSHFGLGLNAEVWGLVLDALLDVVQPAR